MCETCGVVVRYNNQVLTFPSLKIASQFATPGGGIDWDEMPPPSLDDQMDFAIENCWRELKEEAGLDKIHFSSTDVRTSNMSSADRIHLRF
jgi:ADP-ribose pyrophosphatase YjhB (NUDIX family)